MKKNEENNNTGQPTNIHKRCAGCGCLLEAETLGALIPDDEEGIKSYCNDCKLKGADRYFEELDAVWSTSSRNLGV